VNRSERKEKGNIGKVLDGIAKLKARRFVDFV